VGKISARYLKSRFIYDLIPLLPLQFIEVDRLQREFYLVKVMRIFVAFKEIDPHAVMGWIKRLQKMRMESLIINHPQFANNKYVDHNQITTIIFT